MDSVAFKRHCDGELNNYSQSKSKLQMTNDKIDTGDYRASVIHNNKEVVYLRLK